ncbi:RNA polymerase recycling motor HelD [Clostridium sp. HMP27]|uniref:RNA polymerase recycling motor HelD n=1 Tax=Clostridium sp. HMP27 TaxID=1487921 RepID=UPI00052C7A50|nr:RNA polymerase recycling motor HelD [Clostridium sp. HMP27]KGK89668.1 ATPase AAA [Clostridium sp. HMP27]
MAIHPEELQGEKEKLEETKNWLKDEIKYLEGNVKEFNEKVQKLKKESKGKYSFELDTAIHIQEANKEKAKNYKEVKGAPYFARIDFRERLRDAESFYIGKIGLNDEKEQEEKVIDWRAPIADLYYSGTEGKSSYYGPYGEIEGELSLKRKFLIKGGKIKDAFDEGANQIILKVSENGEEALQDEFLRINLEESANKKLKDIVATIQKEQNDIIRSEKNRSLIVQGSAGSGKTTVALHRLAYLLYKYKKNITGEDVLVVAPNNLFLDYISEVLPNLGAGKVNQFTYEELALKILKTKLEVYNKDKKLAYVIENNMDKEAEFITTVSKVKGSILFKNVIDRYIKYIQLNNLDYEDIEVCEYTLFRGKDIKKLFLEGLKHLPMEQRKKEINSYFNKQLDGKVKNIHAIIDAQYEFLFKELREMPEGEEKRNQIKAAYEERDNLKGKIKADSKKIIKNYFSDLGKININKVYLGLFEEEIYEKLTEGKIPKNIWEKMKKESEGNFEKGFVDSDDLAALLYLKFNLEGVSEEDKFKHIVVDEAQDYSLFQLYVLKSMVSNNSFTIVGDTGQSIYYYKGIDDWKRLIEFVYDGDANYVALSQSYRSTVEIVNFANIVLKKQQNSLKPAQPVLRHGMIPEIIKYDDYNGFVDIIQSIENKMNEENRKTIALIGKDSQECENIKNMFDIHGIEGWKIINEEDKRVNSEKIIIPSYMTKGLEFDCSIIINGNDENYKEDELDKRLLYVVLTRALHNEYVLYSGNLTTLLKE